MNHLNLSTLWALIGTISSVAWGLLAAVTPDAAVDPLGHANALMGLGFLGTVAFVAIGLWVWSERRREDDRKKFDEERERREQRHAEEREKFHREFSQPVVQAIERNTEVTRDLATNVKEFGNIKQVLDEIRAKK